MHNSVIVNSTHIVAFALYTAAQVEVSTLTVCDLCGRCSLRGRCSVGESHTFSWQTPTDANNLKVNTIITTCRD